MEYRLAAADPERSRALGRACGVGATVAQVLLHRGITDERGARSFLAAELAGLTRPEAMADRQLAADRLARAVRGGERIAVFGDYDVDGTTSAALIADVLQTLGAEVVVFAADRFEAGYGLAEPALARILQARPSLIVTCDCGSSDHERLARAAADGIDTIVVDHHLVPAEPLPAFAFLNPHRPECGFPYKGLCSAGLALSLAAAVRQTLGVELDLRPWLDLVALGTIADLVPLDGDNRRLVRAGLARLAAVDARPGVRALREAARLRVDNGLGVTDVAFRMTPRLNAPGRLGASTLALSLLRARDLTEARTLAAQIERVNDERKRIEAEVTRQALAQAREVYGEAPRTGIVVASPGWHRGVVGISAARLAETLDCPSIVIGLDGELGHGSCRAPDGHDVYALLAACRDELERFGGHRGAGGLSVRAARLDALRAGFSAAVASSETRAGEAPPPLVDVALDAQAFELPRAEELDRLEPLGEANPEPLFLLRGARVERQGVVGEEHLKLRLTVDGRALSAFGPRMAARAPSQGALLTLLGTLRPDRWAGQGVELQIRDFEAAG